MRLTIEMTNEIVFVSVSRVQAYWAYMESGQEA